MGLRLSGFSGIGLDEEALAGLLEEHRREVEPRLHQLWGYYRNAMRGGGWCGAGDGVGVPGVDGSAGPVGGSGGRAYELAQECGLPDRLRRSHGGVRSDGRVPEVVIENDIGWRIDALVDFVFGKSLAIESTASDPMTRRVVDRVISAVLEKAGGIAFLQDMLLLGSVHGYVDVLVRGERLMEAAGRRVRTDVDAGLLGSSDADGFGERVARMAGLISLELIDATRSIPVLDRGDYRVLRGHVTAWRRPASIGRRRAYSRGVMDALRGRLRGDSALDVVREWASVVEVRSGDLTQRYVDGVLEGEWSNPLGEVPVVHIQNASQPFRYAGLSDVEALIPLQDELNTRLSDRAYRVTMQSFKMFLAKGIDGFGRTPVGPGQVWLADDPDASVEAFGGDMHSPSESSHIQEVRDAMDKASGVSPVVLGVIRERLGHLSSENALRVTLMGVLSKTARKRSAYGRGLERMCELVLAWLDRAGVFSTRAEDRGVRLRWPDPLPIDERDRLRAALLKRDLGVGRTTLLEELGYETGGGDEDVDGGEG